MAQLCPLLGCTQSHCGVTQRANPTRLCLSAPAETWHTRYRPAGCWDCAHQPVSSPQGCCCPVTLPTSSAVSLPALAGQGTPEPPPWAGSRARSHLQGQRGKRGVDFQMPHRCHRIRVAAGDWHSSEPPGHWLCSRTMMPRAVFVPKPPPWPHAHTTLGAGLAGGLLALV